MPYRCEVQNPEPMILEARKVIGIPSVVAQMEDGIESIALSVTFECLTIVLFVVVTLQLHHGRCALD
jgi:hypothetical protein